MLPSRLLSSTGRATVFKTSCKFSTLPPYLKEKLMRTCCKCKENKDESEFFFRNKEKGLLQRECKTCRGVRSRGWYDNNKELTIERSQIQLKEKKEWFKELKSQLRCERCGENHIACLEFHHKDPKEKEFVIGQFRNKSKEVILKEIEKCIVLCANCHRKEHWPV